MMLVILAEFGRGQRADFGKGKCKCRFAIEGAGTEPGSFQKGKDESADRNKNDVKRRVHIDIKPCVFLQDPHRQHVHEINPIRMLGNERQKRTFQLDIF